MPKGGLEPPRGYPHMALNYPDVVGAGFHLREMNIGKYDAEGGTLSQRLMRLWRRTLFSMRFPSRGPELARRCWGGVSSERDEYWKI